MLAVAKRKGITIIEGYVALCQLASVHGILAHRMARSTISKSLVGTSAWWEVSGTEESLVLLSAQSVVVGKHVAVYNVVVESGLSFSIQERGFSIGRDIDISVGTISAET